MRVRVDADQHVGVDLINPVHLPREPVGIKAVHQCEPFRVVRDRQVMQTLRAGRLRHGLDTVVTIAFLGVCVQVAAQIGPLHQTGS